MRYSSLTSSATREETSPPTLDTKLLWLLTVAAGMTVANLYYGQPLLANIASSFSIAAGQVGLLGTLTQLGYGLGLLLLVPLGDSRERRSLIVSLLLLETVALLSTAFAPTIGVMLIVSPAIGFFTIIPQIIIPFVANLASAEQRGKMIGTVLSGTLIGILLARTVSGVLGNVLGWRAMYGIAAGLMLLLALVLWRALPKQAAHSRSSYPQLLSSVWEIVRTERALRPVCLFGALAFAGFNIFWITLAFFLRTSPYHFGSDVVGLFGIVGVAGAIAAPLVGKVADRTGRPSITIGLGLGMVFLAFGVFWLWGTTLAGLVIGVILLDLGSQSTLVSCQAIVQSLRPEARSRVNTVFMTTYFLGGALGSALGSYGWSVGGWSLVCALGVALLLLALLVFLFTALPARRA